MNITNDMDTWLGLMAGVDVLADSIKYTLGPEGRNVAMHQKAGLRGADYSDAPQPGAHILVTNDGATIARSLVLKEPLKNMGVQLLKEAAARTNDSAFRSSPCRRSPGRPTAIRGSGSTTLSIPCISSPSSWNRKFGSAMSATIP